VLSEGAYAGCVQVTSAGLPVILLAEHQTTGGYATAACTIAADVPRAGQLKAGDRVRLSLVSRADAVHSLAALHRTLARYEIV
jgi:allophanate hydrolase subunit 2